MNRWFKNSVTALLMLLFCVVFSPQAAAAGNALTISGGSGTSGEQIAVTVRLQSDEILGGSCDLIYNSVELALSEKQPNTDFLCLVNEKEPGVIRLTFAGTAVIEDAVLCTLVFDITESTLPDGSAIRAQNVRFYDANSSVVEVSVTAGEISRESVLLSLSAAETVEQQAARIELSLSGNRAIAGGNFTVTYDPALVEATGVIRMEGAAGALLNYNLSEPGKVQISVAGQSALPMGKLCAVIFRTVGSSGGKAELSLTDVRVYDENTAVIDHMVAGGSVSIVLPGEDDPKLWIVGGALQADGTAEIRVLLQGRGLVSGGQFTLCYDAAKATAATVTPQSGAILRHDAAAGEIHVSWASVTALPENAELLYVKFENAAESALTFGENSVRVYDENDRQITVVDLRPSALTAAAIVTAVVDTAEVDAERQELTVSVDLADVRYFAEEATETVAPVLALYDESGKMTGLVLPEAKRLENGVASVELTAALGTASRWQVLLLDNAETIAPLCGSLGETLNKGE